MESFLEDLRRESEGTCHFAKLLAEMSSELREQVFEALADRNLSTVAIARKLTSRGHSIGRHRLQECRTRCTCGVVRKTTE